MKKSVQITDNNTTLQQIKSAIAVFETERGWDNPVPRDMAISITLEAAELLEHFQWSDQIDVTGRRQEITDELADVLVYLIRLALVLDVDVASAFFDKLERAKQKYPTTIFNPQSQIDIEQYRHIKLSHRKGKVR